MCAESGKKKSLPKCNESILSHLNFIINNSLPCHITLFYLILFKGRPLSLIQSPLTTKGLGYIVSGIHWGCACDKDGQIVEAIFPQHKNNVIGNLLSETEVLHKDSEMVYCNGKRFTVPYAFHKVNYSS